VQYHYDNILLMNSTRFLDQLVVSLAASALLDHQTRPYLALRCPVCTIRDVSRLHYLYVTEEDDNELQGGAWEVV
jgi:hypothetical protein